MEGGECLNTREGGEREQGWREVQNLSKQRKEKNGERKKTALTSGFSFAPLSETMPRPLLLRGGLVCCCCYLCCLLLLSPPSSSSCSSAATSAAGALLPERDATAAATTTAATFASSSSSFSSSPRRLGGGRIPASLGCSFSSKSRLRQAGGDCNEQRRGENKNDDIRRRSSFSVVDSATAPAAPAAATALPRSRLLSRRRRSHSLQPTIDIYVRTYGGDAAWLTWLLRSVEENVEPSAFRNLVVSVPRGDAKPLLPSFCLPIVLLVVDDGPFERATKSTKGPAESGGYHAQMFDKLSRPPLFSDADFFVHVDSDCVFKRQPVAGNGAEEGSGAGELHRKISRLDFVDARGRVRVRRVAFASLPEPFRRWQRAAEGMLLEKVPHETMSCFPLVLPREVYGLVREIVLERHGGEKWREEGGGGGRGGNGNSVNTTKDASSRAASLFFEVLSHRLDDFGEFTALGHVLTTRMEKGKTWISDLEVEDEEEEDGKGERLEKKGKRGKDDAPPPLLSNPKSSSARSFCALAQQAWSWGRVTPEAAVEAERSLRVG